MVIKRMQIAKRNAKHVALFLQKLHIKRVSFAFISEEDWETEIHFREKEKNYFV